MRPNGSGQLAVILNGANRAAADFRTKRGDAGPNARGSFKACRRSLSPGVIPDRIPSPKVRSPGPASPMARGAFFQAPTDVT